MLLRFDKEYIYVIVNNVIHTKIACNEIKIFKRVVIFRAFSYNITSNYK